jgi:peptidoglycan/xylan/chitin deacetylase (PgdA/CDA1 family)
MTAKALLRNGAAGILFRAGITAPQRRAAGRLSIVTFHRVLPEAERRGYPFPGLAVTPEELDAFLAYFTAHFDCGPLAVQHERHLRGEAVTRPLLALTFDDAQYDNHRNARPLLARHRVKATFFAPVQAIERQELLWHDRLGFAVLALEQQKQGRERLATVLARAGISGDGPLSLARNATSAAKKLALETRLRLVDEVEEAAGRPRPPEFARLMTLEELAELARDGHEIGSHSMTHCLMPECTDSALAWETAESRRTLHARLGQPIETFCYPNGNADGRTARAVEQAGYRRAVTTCWGINGQDADRFLLHRCDMNAEHVRDARGNLVPAMIAFRMSGLYPGLK